MPPDDFVILLPWHHYVHGAHFRAHLTALGVAGIRVDDTYHYTIRDADDEHILTAPGSKDSADESARTAGWILLDADPQPKRGALGPWMHAPEGRRRMCLDDKLGAVCRVNRNGWWVTITIDGAQSIAARGPQTGALGERMATVAALALGFEEDANAGRYPLPLLLLELDCAFKVRDLEWIERHQDEVIAAAEPELLRLWVGYCALLTYGRVQEDFHGHMGGYARAPSVTAATNVLLAQQDIAWTAYLARRKQQP